MSVSTDGIIFYGWLFDEGHEFPWEGYTEGDWWRRVSGGPCDQQLYDKRGDHLPGVTQEMVDAYFKQRREWDKANPAPFAVVNYCSDNCPIFAIAVSGTVKTANRGFPEKFEPAELAETGDAEWLIQAIGAVRNLCAEHDIELPGQPAWYLASYWG